MFGRVQGGWRTVVRGVMPLGAILGGLVAGTFGLATPFLLAAAGSSVPTADPATDAFTDGTELGADIECIRPSGPP